jgi:hypothetical protein
MSISISTRARRFAVALAALVMMAGAVSEPAAGATTPVRVVRLSRDVSITVSGLLTCTVSAPGELSFAVAAESTEAGNHRLAGCGSDGLVGVADLGTFLGGTSYGYHFVSIAARLPGDAGPQPCAATWLGIEIPYQFYSYQLSALGGAVRAPFPTVWNPGRVRYGGDVLCGGTSWVHVDVSLTEGWRAEAA